MRISEIVAFKLAENGVNRVFGLSGGASLHLLKAVNDHPQLTLTCLHHEQNVAMAAEAWSRMSDTLGVAIVTSGPGATNLITGIAGAFFDSVPVLFITGQVSTSRMKGSLAVRQIGFQETPIVEIVKSITKYAVTIDAPDKLEVELQKAICIAKSGRMGPVLIDIPDDIQRMDIVFNSQIKQAKKLSIHINENKVVRLRDSLRNSMKPIIICGAGIQLTRKRETLRRKLDALRVPTVVTWGAKDLIPGESSYLLGTFGTHGERHVNIALNKADLIITIGTRLDLKATGSPVSSFAPNAKKIMLDIDEGEIEKFEGSGLNLYESVRVDIDDEKFDEILDILEFKDSKLEDWKSELASIKESLSPEKRIFLSAGVNPYLFIESLSDSVTNPTNLIVDTGCAIAWTMQTWKTKSNQRIFHDFNNTAMGWSIPATIASVLSHPEKSHICLIGDGSLMMSLSDLSTLSNLDSPSKIIIFNNSGYGMIKQTQDQWFDSEYFASDSNVDLKFPNFSQLARAMGFDYYSAKTNARAFDLLSVILEHSQPLIFEVFIQNDSRVIPMVKFGNPNHIMEP